MWQKCLKVDRWIWLRDPCTLKLKWPRRTSAWWWFSRQVVSNSLWPHRLCRPPGSSVHGILHVGTLEWVAISFSKHLHITYQNVPYKFDGLKSKIWTSFNLSAKLSFLFSKYQVIKLITIMMQPFLNHVFQGSTASESPGNILRPVYSQITP